MAFYKSHPFYQRPGRDNIKDQTLWNKFKDRFLEASEAILDRSSPEARLPALWVERQLSKERQLYGPLKVVRDLDEHIFVVF